MKKIVSITLALMLVFSAVTMFRTNTGNVKLGFNPEDRPWVG